MAKKQLKLERAGVFSIKEVLADLTLNDQDKRSRSKSKTKLGEHEVKLGTRQYIKMFKLKGTKCVRCTLEGDFFAVERHQSTKEGGWHLNLYAIDNEGDEVLMTKDHIIPKAKGGRNGLDNLQPMCCMCNTRKADTIEESKNG